ncbi:hypothetical protein F511_42190 [Dorcoceras hygrometricum]|uniref:Uncharacterized protein n=1 Tax=Dorcoceras hygrometricum TaxID=472368 RepID=A0A2Z7C8E3_9LAMI|nr:hypothetical protein F511_42190 [Dorcoceras hygrometricum]
MESGDTCGSKIGRMKNDMNEYVLCDVIEPDAGPALKRNDRRANSETIKPDVGYRKGEEFQTTQSLRKINQSTGMLSKTRCNIEALKPVDWNEQGIKPDIGYRKKLYQTQKC